MTRHAVSATGTRATAVEGCLDACSRCRTLTERVCGSSVAEEAYRAIGPHLRHCVDHFDCLLRGLDEGLVDYDARERDAGLESDPKRLVAALDSIVQRLGDLAGADAGRELRIRQTAASHGAVAVVTSNLERELVFLAGHTIHHLAIMKLLAQSRGVRIPEPLDLAFSTEAYLEKAD